MRAFREVADASLRHHRNRDGIHDLADDADRGHARHAAVFANIGRDALQRHDGGGAGFFGNLGLLDVGHVHDDAAFEHLGQADFQAEVFGKIHNPFSRYISIIAHSSF